MQLVSQAETITAIISPVDIDLGAVDANGNTPQMVARRLDVAGLAAGDKVLLTAREEFTTGSADPNWNAAGAWTVLQEGGARVVSEHWSLWVMCAWGIRRTLLPSGNPVWARRQTAMNIDAQIHHMTQDFTEWDTIPTAGDYRFETVVYFSRSSAYYRPGATVRVEPGYGMLSAAVFR